MESYSILFVTLRAKRRDIILLEVQRRFEGHGCLQSCALQRVIDLLLQLHLLAKEVDYLALDDMELQDVQGRFLG
jgi:hypothetical protein